MAASKKKKALVLYPSEADRKLIEGVAEALDMPWAAVAEVFLKAGIEAMRKEWGNAPKRSDL
jgi:hypothetical protein